MHGLRARGARILSWSASPLNPAAGRIAALVLVSGTPGFTTCEDWPHGLSQATVRALAGLLGRHLSALPAREQVVAGDMITVDSGWTAAAG